MNERTKPMTGPVADPAPDLDDLIFFGENWLTSDR